MNRDFDNPWKDTLTLFLPDFLELYFHDLFEAIDWSIPFDSLDTELQQLTRESDHGKAIADKLFRVTLLNGNLLFLLLHVEIQVQVDSELSRRIFRYAYRILDRYDLPLVSLVVLGDPNPNWKPTEYWETNFGCRIGCQYRTVKLLETQAKLEQLRGSDNPLVLITLAHLISLQERDHEKRFLAKSKLVEVLLLEKKWSKDRIQQTYLQVDWLLQLPVELEQKLDQKIERESQMRAMPYVPHFYRERVLKWTDEYVAQRMEAAIAERLESAVTERLESAVAERLESAVTERLESAVAEKVAEIRDQLQSELEAEKAQQIKRETLYAGIEMALSIRFGHPGEKLVPRIRKISDLSRLEALLIAAKTLDSLTEFKKLLKS